MTRTSFSGGISFCFSSLTATASLRLPTCLLLLVLPIADSALAPYLNSAGAHRMRRRYPRRPSPRPLRPSSCREWPSSRRLPSSARQTAASPGPAPASHRESQPRPRPASPQPAGRAAAETAACSSPVNCCHAGLSGARSTADKIVSASLRALDQQALRKVFLRMIERFRIMLSTCSSLSP